MSYAEQNLLTLYAQQHDAEAFRSLVERHGGMVFGTCHRILGNAADAEDAAQNCFLQLTLHAGELRAPIAAWLHTIARRVSLDILRNRKSRRAREAATAVTASASIKSPSWDDVKDAVDNAVGALPEDLRTPILMHYMEGRRQEDIAEELGLSQATVSRRLASGVETLRGRMRKAGWIISAALLGALLTERAGEGAPAALTAALGKMALAGSTASSTAGAQSTGFVAASQACSKALMTKCALAAAAVIFAGAAAFVAVHYWHNPGVTSSARPQAAAQAIESEESPAPARTEKENVMDSANEAEDGVIAGARVAATSADGVEPEPEGVENNPPPSVAGNDQGALVDGAGGRAIAVVGVTATRLDDVEPEPEADENNPSPSVAEDAQGAAFVDAPAERAVAVVGVAVTRVDDVEPEPETDENNAPPSVAGNAQGAFVDARAEHAVAVVGVAATRLDDVEPEPEADENNPPPSAARNAMDAPVAAAADSQKTTAASQPAGVMLAAVAAEPRASGYVSIAPPPERVVHFPKDRSLGVLNVIQVEQLDQFQEPQVRGPNFAGWNPLCEARGDVTVPAGKLLGLSVFGNGCRNLAGLASLKRDDLYMLSLAPYENEMSSVDACMPYVSSLTELRVLCLSPEIAFPDGSRPRLNLSNDSMLHLMKLEKLEYLAFDVALSDDDLGQICGLKSLKGIYFIGDGLTNAGMAHLSKLPELEELSLRSPAPSSPLGDDGLAHLSKCARLRTLQLSGKGFTNAGLAYMKDIPALRKLNLLRFSLNATGLKHLSALNSLETLNLSSTPIGLAGLSELKKMTSLKSLNLSKGGERRNGITDAWLMQIKDMKSLEELELRNSHLTDKGLTYLAEMPNLRSISGLGGSISDDGLSSLSKLNNLEELSITGTFSDSGMKALADMHHLRKLRLWGGAMSNEGIRALAKVTTLQDLEIGPGNEITTTGVNSLNALKGLKRLTIYLDKGADDGTLDLSGLTQLESLNLNTFEKNREPFQDEDLACLKNLHQLRSLLLSPRKFSDAGVANLAGLTQMQNIWVGGPDLTDRGLSFLDGMKGLTTLSIDDGHFTDAGLRHIEPLVCLHNLGLPSDKGFSDAAMARLRSQLPIVALMNEM